jgi:hypothetical protein
LFDELVNHGGDDESLEFFIPDAEQIDDQWPRYFTPEYREGFAVRLVPPEHALTVQEQSPEPSEQTCTCPRMRFTKGVPVCLVLHPIGQFFEGLWAVGL